MSNTVPVLLFCLVVGVLLYEFLDGRPPFESTRHLELVQRIITVDISMPQVCASEANFAVCTLAFCHLPLHKTLL